MGEPSDRIRINRAPVLTLWAAVVAERLGFDRATALTLGQAVAGLSAYAKGVSARHHRAQARPGARAGDRLGEGEQLHVDLLGRAVPVVRTPDGLRAVSKGKPGNPARIEKYLAAKFGDRLDEARQAMAELAAAYAPTDLYRRGFQLYEAFRPEVPAGESGWGAKGRLNLAAVRALTRERRAAKLAAPQPEVEPEPMPCSVKPKPNDAAPVTGWSGRRGGCRSWGRCRAGAVVVGAGAVTGGR